MRVINQDNSIDVPYEKCIFWTNEDDKGIYCAPAGESKDVMRFATYSTAEKMKEEFCRLRRQYVEFQDSFFVFRKED